ncbi:uncharacterized protein A4U43_C03F10670 [Asparagus officinalis]|uniref:ParB-like N-terminal domain-containing protein n=1 Tax=Asparagus officinalis TaxID=4686 RepID=A0A5P1FE46_ASPOF|nr:uncharacterized protein A4U43_C03F10670 [Asparagus officinalis]
MFTYSTNHLKVNEWVTDSPRFLGFRRKLNFSSSSFKCSQSNISNERLHILLRRRRPHPFSPRRRHKHLHNRLPHKEPPAVIQTSRASKLATRATALAVAVNNKPIATTGTRGAFSFTFGKNSVVGVCWDFSAAKYSLGPEPISDFYVAVIFNDEFALLVGDRSKEFVDSFGCGDNPIADFSMVSRTVKVVGRAIYSTKARFYDEGKEHEIMIKFQGELELSMHVDEKKVLHVRRLRWNFRGNETVFVDGLAVDVMWDLFPWLFEDPAGCAVVLLRTRAAAGRRGADCGWRRRRSEWVPFSKPKSGGLVILDIPLDKIRRPLMRTRANDPQKVKDLMDSISQIGLQEPIDVLEVEGVYYGFSGCHRFEAHQRLGLPTIRCKIRRGTKETLRVRSVNANAKLLYSIIVA